MLREMKELFKGDDDDEQPRGRHRRQYGPSDGSRNNTRTNGNNDGQPRYLRSTYFA